MKYRAVLSLGLAVFLMLNIFSMSAYANRYSDVVYCKKNSQMKIALTFDDGPHPVYTGEILDILKEYGVRATFFVVGENVERYPELVIREIAEGHEVGNHTHSHKHLSKTPSAEIIREIEACERIIYQQCGEYRTKLFRPPEGVLPSAVHDYARDADYTVVLWSVDTYDWAHNPINEIMKNIKRNTEPGDIILMHDSVKDSLTPTALRQVIPYLLDQGYSFVTVSELLGCQ